MTAGWRRGKSFGDVRVTIRLHGNGGPVPVRRIPPDQWPPLSKALESFAGERQYSFVADMNADFRDGYANVPISNWPNKRASAAICYLDAAVRARPNLAIHSYATATEIKFDDLILRMMRVAGAVA